MSITPQKVAELRLLEAVAKEMGFEDVADQA
jgi:hypothetical protein